jgi:hypothetical protein
MDKKDLIWIIQSITMFLLALFASYVLLICGFTGCTAQQHRNFILHGTIRDQQPQNEIEK